MSAADMNTEIQLDTVGAGEVATAFVKLTHYVHHVWPDERLSPRKPDLVYTFPHKEPCEGEDLLCGQQVGLGGQWDALLGHAVLT